MLERMIKMNKEFYINNRKKIIEGLKDNSILLLHSGMVFQSTGDQNFPFNVNRNFYYLTGINQEDVILMIIKGLHGVREYLFIEENDLDLCKWVGFKLTKEEARSISGVENVLYRDDFEKFLYSNLNPSRKNYEEIQYLYLDLERRQDLEYTTLPFRFSRRFKNDYPEIKIENIYSKIVRNRMIKSKEEVDLIKASIETTRKGLENVMRNIKPGLYEYQAETYYDSAIKWDGQKDYSFKTICASGKNATILHYVDNNAIIKDNDLVLFDLGCQTNFYISDISRTYPANGKFTPRQKQIYEIVLNCNKECIKFIKPGITWKEYNEYANSLLIKGLKKIGLIKKDEELIKYYWHSIGHSIGLDTHDPSIENVKFTKGMLTTVEPGLYLEDEGIGIRIEDNVLVTDDGCINLSSSIIKEIDEIENFMAKESK